MKTRMLLTLSVVGLVGIGCKKDAPPVAAVTPPPAAAAPAAPYESNLRAPALETAPAGDPSAPALPDLGAEPFGKPETPPANPADPFGAPQPAPANSVPAAADPFGAPAPAQPAPAKPAPAVDDPFGAPAPAPAKPELPKPEPPKPVERVWTRTDGKTVTATFVKFEDGKVTIITPSGKTGALPLESLSDEDKEYVKQMSAAAPGPAPAPVPAPVPQP